MMKSVKNSPGRSAGDRDTDSWGRLLAGLGALTVRQAKHYSCRLPLFGRPHRHDDLFHFCYVRTGKSRIRIDGEVFHVGPDDMIFIRPGQWHESINDKRVDYELVEIRMAVDAERAQRLIPAFRSVTHVGNAGVFFPVLERVVTAHQLDPFAGNWLVRVRLVEMMMLLAREAHSFGPVLSDRPAADTVRRIQKAVDYMAMHYGEPVRIEDLASLCGWSSGHFSSTFHRVMEVSPIEFLVRRRLHHARELLRNSTLQVQQISELCGFSSPQYFVRVFARRQGVSPGKYRRQR